MKKIATAILLASTAFLAACTFLFDQPHLPDDKLIKNFKSHRAGFEKLAAMLPDCSCAGRVSEMSELPL